MTYSLKFNSLELKKLAYNRIIKESNKLVKSLENFIIICKSLYSKKIVKKKKLKQKVLTSFSFIGLLLTKFRKRII